MKKHKRKCFPLFHRMEPVETGLLSPIFAYRCTRCGWEYRENAISMTSGWVPPPDDSQSQ